MNCREVDVNQLISFRCGGECEWISFCIGIWSRYMKSCLTQIRKGAVRKAVPVGVGDAGKHLVVFVG